MNRNVIHKIYLLVLALLLASAGTLYAGKKPDITRHEATLLQNAIQITVEWQAQRPVVLLKATVGGQSTEVELDEYDDNTRDRHGFYGEADVSVSLEPYEAFVQKDYIPYVIQIRDNLGRKSEITGRVKVKPTEEVDRYPGGMQVKADDSGEYKTKHIIRDVLEIIKQRTTQPRKGDSDYRPGQDPNWGMDAEKPVISLHEGDYVTVDVGTPYKEPGATAVDKDGNDISGSIVTAYFKNDQKVSGVDTSGVGVYYVQYDVTDRYGISAVTVYRTVEVVDSAAPEITLFPEGNPDVTVEVKAPYTDPGAIVTDSEGNKIAEFNDIDRQVYKYDEQGNPREVNNVETKEAADYAVTYDFQDSSGKAAPQQIRYVYVSDSAAPEITLLPEGNPHVTVEVGNAYKEFGCKAYDKDGKDITHKVKIDGYVDTNNAGTYYVYYDVADDYGIAAETAMRIVNVVDSTTPKESKKPPPIIKWKGMPPTATATQVIPPKIQSEKISLKPGLAPPPQKTTRVYYKAKLPPTGSTINKADSAKLQPGRITLKPGVTSQQATQPTDDQKARCKNYATAAVKQSRENKERGCGYQGSRWSSDYNFHYNLCLQKSKQATDAEAKARAADLQRCSAASGGKTTQKKAGTLIMKPLQ